MRTPASRLPLVVPFAAALALLGAACAGEDAGDDAAPADTVSTAAEQGASDVPVSTGIQPGQSSTTDALITNTMPHAMIVTVRYEGGGDTELGVVPPNGEQSFTMAASAGETVTLVATDEADTHSRESTVTLTGQPQAWTIE